MSLHTETDVWLEDIGYKFNNTTSYSYVEHADTVQLDNNWVQFNNNNEIYYIFKK